jgi:hypothetical protein
MLVEKREAVELRTRNCHLEVVPGPCAVLHVQLGGIGKRTSEERADRLGFHRGNASPRGSLGRMRLLRTLVIFELGAWVGMVTAAALVKRALPSRGSEESDEVTLVSIFDGIELESRARSFRGGSMLAWCGGVSVDLRGATLAPDARLTIGALFGGVDVQVPPGWRVVSTARAIAGGVADHIPEPEDPDAPTLTIESTAAFGGVSIRTSTAEPALGSEAEPAEHAPVS